MAQVLGRGFTWLDTGTMDSLADASAFVQMIQNWQGVVISAPEEIAYKHGWITKEKLLESAERYGKSPYGQHLKNVATGKFIELARLEKVFESNWIGKGKLVAEFEEKYAEHLCTTRNRVLMTKYCSEGLFSSMHLCDVQPSDEVILPTISFVGAGNAVCANVSKMVLCDVDKRTLNARAEDIEKCITPREYSRMLISLLIIHYACQCIRV